MNEVDQLLSQTADYFEQHLRDNPGAIWDLSALVRNGQKPTLARPLAEVPGAVLLINVVPVTGA